MDKKNQYSRFVSDSLLCYLRKREEETSIEVENLLWKRIEHTVGSHGPRRVVRRLVWTFSTAAALVACVWFGYRNWAVDEPDLKTQAALLATMAFDEGEVVLVRGNDERISIENGATVDYSAQGSVSVNRTVMNEEEDTADRESYNQIIVPKGKHSRLLLADGSCLDINAGSRVVYPSHFAKGKREIYVEGEVFLDVKRNESAPFIVRTSRFEVEVLGTAFNVSAYKDEALSSVVLLRGAVNVKSESGEALNLVPNELASISGGVILGKRSVDAQAYMSWTKGILVLNEEPLHVVLRKLERYFDRKIIVTSSMSSTPLCGKIDLNEGIEEIIRFISVTAPIITEEREGIFYISPK